MNIILSRLIALIFALFSSMMGGSSKGGMGMMGGSKKGGSKGGSSSKGGG
jgi:hypothetical protein